MSQESTIPDQADMAFNMLEMAGFFVKESVLGFMNEVVKEMSTNEDFVKGVVMVSAFILLIRQIYLNLRRGEQLSKETLVRGIRESTDEVVEDFTRMTNDVKEKIQGMKLRNSKVVPQLD